MRGCKIRKSCGLLDKFLDPLLEIVKFITTMYHFIASLWGYAQVFSNMNDVLRSEKCRTVLVKGQASWLTLLRIGNLLLLRNFTENIKNKILLTDESGENKNKSQKLTRYPST